MAIYRFEVVYNSEKKHWGILSHSDNVSVPHSGSSYLRIIPKDESFRGTIDSHHPHLEDGETDSTSPSKYLHFCINHEDIDKNS